MISNQCQILLTHPLQKAAPWHVQTQVARRKFDLTSGVIVFSRRQLPAFESNPLATLQQNSTNAGPACISHHLKRLTAVRSHRNRSRRQISLQTLKSLLTFSRPIVWGILPQQTSQGRSPLGKPLHKPPEIIGQTQERPQLANILGSRPFLDSSYLFWINTDTISTQNMPQKGQTVHSPDTLGQFGKKLVPSQNAQDNVQMFKVILSIFTEILEYHQDKPP